MLTMANSDVSLLYLYDNEDEDFIFSSFPVQENRTGELPVLYENSAFCLLRALLQREQTTTAIRY